MWQLTLYPEGGKWTCAAPEEAVLRFQGQKELVKEIRELLQWQYNHIDIIPETAGLPYDTPLEVYCNYSRDQLFAALGFAKPGSIREGVKYLNRENSDVVTTPTDVFLVTLNKSEKEFSDTTLYEDYSMDKSTFHWQSQSTTTPESKPASAISTSGKTAPSFSSSSAVPSRTPTNPPWPTPSWAPPTS